MSNEDNRGIGAQDGADEEEILDDDVDWDYELGLLEPVPEPDTCRAPWVPPAPSVVPVPERDRRVAVLTPEGVGEFLRACRARAGLSQRQLAGAAGIPQTTVARLESGGTQNVQLATVAARTHTRGFRYRDLPEQ